jgi:hypothetical protein
MDMVAIPFTDPVHSLPFVLNASKCPNIIKGFTPMVAILTQRTITTAINRKLLSSGDRYPVTIYFLIFPLLFWKLFRETFYFGGIKPRSNVLTRARWREFWIVKGNWETVAIKARFHYPRILTTGLFLTSRLRALIYHLLQEALIYRWIVETEYNTLETYCFQHPGEVLHLINLFFLNRDPPPLPIRQAAWLRLRNRAIT